MAVKVVEKYLGRSGDDSSRELVFIVKGTNDDQTAIDETLSQAPGTHNGFTRKSVSLTQLAGDGTKDDTYVWETRVSYSSIELPKPPIPETSDVKFSFQTSLSGQKIKQSLNTVAMSPASAQNHKQLINVTTEGNVEGAQIEIPTSSFKYTAFFPNATITQGYVDVVSGLVGKVNSATFKNKAAGTVLFRGVSGSQRSATDWELSYEFAFRANETGITIGGIGPVNKKGWELLWVGFKEEKQLNSNRLVKVPAALYVEQVYEIADFLALGL